MDANPKQKQPFYIHLEDFLMWIHTIRWPQKTLMVFFMRLTDSWHSPAARRRGVCVFEEERERVQEMPSRPVSFHFLRLRQHHCHQTARPEGHRGS